MSISDLHVSALRALLAGEDSEHERLVSELGTEGVRNGYYRLVTAAFGIAVQDRFRDPEAPEPAEWLRGIGAMVDTENAIDQDTAARLIAWVLGEAGNDLDFAEQFPQHSMLLGLLMHERRPDDEELDAFLRRAREHADRTAPA